jgi:DNA-binding SARP family transcriptional activator
MEFCLLGPLVVRQGGVIVPVTARRQRAVLAALVLNAGRLVGHDELAEALWGAAPPRRARVSVQNYVMRLRNALGEAGRARIRTLPGGYVIRVADEELDVSRFEALLDDARAAAGRRSWELAAEYPMRERVHGLLMLALYRDSRQAEALEAYRHARQFLVDELGAEPGPALRELHQRILTGDPALSSDHTPASAPVATGPGRAAPDSEEAVPRQLPYAVRHFTGRARELAALSALADQAGPDAPGPVAPATPGSRVTATH